MQLIKRRLVGKDGSDRVRELRAILAELPGYKNGPYADIRKWVESQLEHTRVQKRVTHRDSIAVRREGAPRSRSSPAERRQVVAAPGAVQHPDQDRGLRVHDDAAGAGADSCRRRARAAGSRSQA